MSNNDYVRLSLELHLFFDRIMREHSFFLETSFTEKDNDLKKIANDFRRIFSELLVESIELANGNIDSTFINNDEIVTKNTLEAEKKSSNLSGVFIDTSATIKELNLQSGSINANPQLLSRISELNIKTLPAIQGLTKFKTDILMEVLSCKMYTTNYPLLINHIINEAKMYYQLLNKIENREVFSQNYIYEQELFWNDIMKEHAEFIRGTLDPTEKQLILKADEFADNYERIIRDYTNPLALTAMSLQETINFRNFKIAGEEGILNCKIRSIIIPLLSDHVVREANHFLRILRSVNIN